MRIRVEGLVKALIVSCAILVLWCVWVSAQGTTGAPEIEFAEARYEVLENAGSATILVRRSGATNTAAGVDLVTIGGTAPANSYSLAAGLVAFPPGVTEQKVSLSVRDNSEPQPTRSIKLALSNPAGARLGSRTTAEIFIVDNDGPSRVWLSFGLSRIPALNRVTGGVPLWQYLASVIYVVLAFVVAKFIDLLLRPCLKKWSEHTRGRFDDLFVELLRAPLRMILFVILLHIGLNLFAWPGWFERIVSTGLTLLVAVSLIYTALKLIDLFTGYWKQRASTEERAFSEQLLPIIRNTAKVFAIVIGVLLALGNLGVNITSLITSLGIGGLALALAAQDTLANFFGAIVIVLDKPFRIGDHIQLPGVDGTVEAVGFRSTRVRGADGNLIYIPNKTIGNATITNVARASSIRAVINLAIPYSTPAGKIRRATQVLQEVLQAAPRTKEFTVTVNRFGESALNLEVVHVWDGTDGKAHGEMLQELNLTIKKRLEEESIELALPSRTVYLRQDGLPARATA
jgi:MscS family membrane protein